jgi:hypothetical protein
VVASGASGNFHTADFSSQVKGGWNTMAWERKGWLTSRRFEHTHRTRNPEIQRHSTAPSRMFSVWWSTQRVHDLSTARIAAGVSILNSNGENLAAWQCLWNPLGGVWATARALPWKVPTLLRKERCHRDRR